jgi:hypothetical protein
MKPKIYTLKDFEFKPHGVIKGAVQGMLKLPNNITVSIVGGGFQSIVGGMNRLYGDGVDTFEVAAWYTDSGDWITLGDNNDILEYVDKDRLLFLLFELSQK